MSIMDYGRINHFWQSMNLLVAPVLLTLLILFKDHMTPWMWLMAIHLPILMIHEVEEYVLAPEGFKEFFNKRSPLGTGSDPDYPVDEGYVFQVNILIAWPLIILGAVLANIAPWVGMSMVWFQIIINNVMHTIGLQQGKPTYNPGLLTNCLIIVPYCVYCIYQAYGVFLWYDWSLSLLLGLGITALLMKKTFGRLAVHKARAGSNN